jgi:molecular chaperone HscB
VAVDSQDETQRESVKNALVALLNKRSYLRNLVRDVNQALE